MKAHVLVTNSIILFCLLIHSSLLLAGAVTSNEEITISTTGGGIKVKSDNGNSFSIGGRVLYDYDSYDGVYNADNDGDTGSESEFRRARVHVKGSASEDWAYKITVDVDEG